MTKPDFKIKEKDFKKMSWGMQEALCKKYNVTLTDAVKSKRQIALDILNKIDYTTKEGKAAWTKGFDKYEEYMKKLDAGFEKFDKGLQKMGDSFGKGTGEKSILDDPMGEDKDFLGSKKKKQYGDSF